MPTSRLEAFSDGVFAIAITLLVLEIHVPTDRGADLWRALAYAVAIALAFVNAYLSLGISALVAVYYIHPGAPLTAES